MSDDNPNQQSMPEASDQYQALDNTDLVLQQLVGIVNRYPGTRVGVTLTVAGGIITGDLIGVKEYFEHYGDQWKHLLRSAPEIAEKFKADWTEVGLSHTEAAKNDPEALFRFIHLVNARVVSGSGLLPATGGFIWRGRLEAVSGFSIGSLK